MSDLLAKCDWDEDELRVELPQWPEVVTVWVNDKAMPYVPVVNDSKCDTCEAMLDCDECLRADASHKELRGLQAENAKLRVELTDLRLKSCPSCGIKVENEKLLEQGELLFDKTLELGTENSQLRELVAEIWPIAEYAGYEHELSRARELMRELGYEED